MFLRLLRFVAIVLWGLPSAILAQAIVGETAPVFDAQQDLLALHYDHAPDKDDGHSAAADLLEALYSPEWIGEHVVAVSGAYGLNRDRFDKASDKVMDVVWNERGGWIAAEQDWDKAVETLTQRWLEVLKAGGDIWVKEGGQSDITADVVKKIQERMPDLATTRRIHVVQHSDWNENKTTPADLAFVKQNTEYQRIRDANAYLNLRGGDKKFQGAALAHPVLGESWEAAFAYYPTEHRLDFSDTGELLHILGLGEVGIDEFAVRYLRPASPAD